MPPKRIVTKSSNLKANKPPVPLKQDNGDIDIEAELKFDQEVLWCITQFEKLIKSGKINDAKKNESLKAISTLKRTNIPKIKKIQLMQQYFKDYKTKMQQDEAAIAGQEGIHFESRSQLNGTFVKRKVETSSSSSPSSFLFNFNSAEDELSNDVIQKMSIK